METLVPKCPVCAQEAVQAVVACPRCAVAHHRDCWEYQDRRCAIYGCAPPVAPVEAPPPARSWGTLAYVVVALVLGIARGASNSRRRYEPPPIRIPDLPTMDYKMPPLKLRSLVPPPQIPFPRSSIAPLDPFRTLSPSSRRMLEQMVERGQISCRVVHGRQMTCPRCQPASRK